MRMTMICFKREEMVLRLPILGLVFEVDVEVQVLKLVHLVRMQATLAAVLASTELVSPI